MQDGHDLVAEVRAAAARHKLSWGVLVPDAHRINQDGEEAEEAAWQEMAAAKRRLRDHICRTYGITAGELCSLATT